MKKYSNDYYKPSQKYFVFKKRRRRRRRTARRWSGEGSRRRTRRRKRRRRRRTRKKEVFHIFLPSLPVPSFFIPSQEPKKIKTETDVKKEMMRGLKREGCGPGGGPVVRCCGVGVRVLLLCGCAASAAGCVAGAASHALRQNC
jgi:hypothetical protein